MANGRTRAVALGDEAHAGVDRLLHLDQAFLRAALVVVGHGLELLAAHDAALGVEGLDQELQVFQAMLADRGAAARKRVDVGDLDDGAPLPDA
jgi:hypothetical protein